VDTVHCHTDFAGRGTIALVAVALIILIIERSLLTATEPAEQQYDDHGADHPWPDAAA